MFLDTNAINPYIRLATDSYIKENFVFETRVLFDYELIYIRQGHIKLEYAGKVYPIRKGTFILLHPGVQHSIINSNKILRQPHIHFDLIFDSYSYKRYISFKDINFFSDSEKKRIHYDYLSGNSSPIIKLKNMPYFLELFNEVIQSTNPNSIYSKSKLSEMIHIIVNENFNTSISNSSNTNFLSKQIKEYIERNISSNISLDDIQNYFNYNKFYLDRKFKESYGISIIAYRNKIRFDLSKNMLKTKSVSETAKLLGFSSLYSFSRAFSSYFGYPPSQDKEI